MLCPVCGAAADTIAPTYPQDRKPEAAATDGANPEGSLDLSQFGKYHIIDELGRGGVGVVFRAYDTANRREVALKTLQNIQLDTLQRFKTEFRVMSRVAHPNLVSLYELVADGKVAYFTMELLEGVDFLTYVLSGIDRQTDADGLNGLEETVAVERQPTKATEILAPGQADPTLDYQAAQLAPHTQFLHPGLPTRATRRLTDYQAEKLRDGLRQLVTGVAAIHDAGVLHRDIKPSNVMVTSDGTVKILDFGLALPVEDPESQGEGTQICGTAAYMAPEQAACRELSAASDWYAVGVMIYQALTGQLPIDGKPKEMLRRKQQLDPPSPNQIGAEAPRDLSELSERLLARNPDRRPRLPQVLGVETNRDLDDTELVGRQRHFAMLDDCLAEMTNGVSVFVHGKSGLGKSVLVERFLGCSSISRDTVILRGRCYERESVPYKAWDTLVDSLAEFLAGLRPSEAAPLVPDRVAALARVFPALQIVGAIQSAEPESSKVLDRQELRRQAFAALRELLTRLAHRRPLILYIDDLQWGDVDSATLLSELLSPPEPPPLMFLGCYRSDETSASHFLTTLDELEKQGQAPAGKRDIEVGPLGRDDSIRLAEKLLGPTGNPAHVQAIAEQADGSPFFIAELAKHARDDEAMLSRGSSDLALDEVLWSRVARCPDDERRLLEVIAVAGQPTRREQLFQAAGVVEQGMTLVNLLRADHFIRSFGFGDDVQIETYHDRVRESVIGHLSPAAIKNHHRQLASALEATEACDPERLATHFHEADEIAKAGRYYRAAADQAAEALAFEQAAQFFRSAIELHTGTEADRHELQRKLADALANAGRGREAAEEYLRAAEGAAPSQSIELRRRGTMQYLHCGYVDEGVAVLESVLGEVGMKMPRSPWWAALASLLKGIRIDLRGLDFTERQARDIPDELLQKIDICWFVSVGLSIADPLTATDFSRRGLLLALRAGEPYRLARSICFEAMTSVVTLRPRAGERRTARILKVGDELARRTGEPHALGIVYLVRGATRYLSGYWSDAWDLCIHAAGILRSKCTGVTWELDTANTFSLWSLTYMGLINKLRDRRRVLMKEARDRSDLYAKSILGTYVMSYDRLGEDNPEAAREELEEARGELPKHGFQVRHHNVVLAETLIHIYSGRGEAAWQNINELLWTYRLSGLSMIQHVRIDITQSRARSALAAAAAAKNPARFLRAARRDAGRLAREGAGWGIALSQMVRAGIAAIRGNEGKAVTLLEAAADTFESTDMRLYAAACRWHLGSIIGGDQGQSLVARARLRFSEQNVARPEKMRDMLAPGFSRR